MCSPLGLSPFEEMSPISPQCKIGLKTFKPSLFPSSLVSFCLYLFFFFSFFRFFFLHFLGFIFFGVCYGLGFVFSSFFVSRPLPSTYIEAAWGFWFSILSPSSYMFLSLSNLFLSLTLHFPSDLLISDFLLYAFFHLRKIDLSFGF